MTRRDLRSRARRSQISRLHELDGWYCATVDNIFDAGDRRGAIRRQECNELGDLLRGIGAPDRDATQRIHEFVTRGLAIGSRGDGKPIDHPHRGSRFRKAGRNTEYANAFWSYLHSTAPCCTS